MDHYTPHCFHRGIESFKVAAGQDGSPTEPIDVRSAKIFCVWMRASFNGSVVFDYLWDDKRTLLETSSATALPSGEWVKATFGTYRGFALPAMFLRPRVSSGEDGYVDFCAIAQLQ